MKSVGELRERWDGSSDFDGLGLPQKFWDDVSSLVADEVRRALEDFTEKLKHNLYMDVFPAHKGLAGRKGVEYAIDQTFDSLTKTDQPECGLCSFGQKEHGSHWLCPDHRDQPKSLSEFVSSPPEKQIPIIRKAIRGANEAQRKLVVHGDSSSSSEYRLTKEQVDERLVALMGVRTKFEALDMKQAAEQVNYSMEHLIKTFAPKGYKPPYPRHGKGEASK